MYLTQHILTQNDCYREGRIIVPRGIMVHSTGVAQPNVEVFLKSWDRPGVQACAHAFVHQGGVVETLPWNWRGWHAGTPPNGGVSANNTHISFEILEPAGHTYHGGVMEGYDPEKNAGYFAAVYRNAVDLCVYLCQRYGFDPKTDIVDHAEGYALDIASNHSDVAQWFPKHGKSMDTLRSDVAMRLKGDSGMTPEEFDIMLDQALERRRQALEAQPSSSWAQASWAQAVAIGIFDGTKPLSPLTREQAAVMLERLALLPPVQSDTIPPDHV